VQDIEACGLHDGDYHRPNWESSGDGACLRVKAAQSDGNGHEGGQPLSHGPTPVPLMVGNRAWFPTINEMCRVW
jgi:hypothetical protein